MQSIITRTNTPAESLASCFIRVPDSNSIRITKAGREIFGKRFARHGFNIESLKTKAEFLHAFNVTTTAELNDIRFDRNSEPALKELLARVLD